MNGIVMSLINTRNIILVIGKYRNRSCFIFCTFVHTVKGLPKFRHIDTVISVNRLSILQVETNLQRCPVTVCLQVITSGITVIFRMLRFQNSCIGQLGNHLIVCESHIVGHILVHCHITPAGIENITLIIFVRKTIIHTVPNIRRINRCRLKFLL